ncbi:MAG: HPF/RaiA family ribosome-associated protein [Sediminicola sp.]|tara:strand:+ start:151789 stop:152097 length:309 start_codon:yes stop_codon:yes gene_type:complete
MEIEYEYKNITKNCYFEDILEDKLTTFSKKHPFVNRVRVLFKFDHLLVEGGSICKIMVDGPAPYLTSSSNEASFELAICSAVRELERELEKRRMDQGHGLLL